MWGGRIHAAQTNLQLTQGEACLIRCQCPVVCEVGCAVFISCQVCTHTKHLYTVVLSHTWLSLHALNYCGNYTTSRGVWGKHYQFTDPQLLWELYYKQRCMGQTLSVYRPSTTEETILQAEVYGANTISVQTLNYCRHCKQNQLAVCMQD